MDNAILKEGCDRHEKLKHAREVAQSMGWKRTVKVWAIGNDPIHWHMDSSLIDPVTGYLRFDKENDKMPKRDYYVIDFNLQDHTGLNLEFKPNPMKAFSVAVTGDQPPVDCPGEGSYSDSIYAICCDQNGKTLTIRNDDMDVEYFSFALYFDSDDGDQRYDPGGDNQNGNYRYD